MILKWIFISFLIVTCSLCGLAIFFFERDVIDFSALEIYSSSHPSIVLDDTGNEFTRFQLDKREPLSFEKLPNILIKAFVAAEDHDFFEHRGISIRGIIRSFLVNLYHGRYVQGASTITQQLSRSMFLTSKRTLIRKAQEAFLAFQLEQQLSKEQILELYLNNMYFGRGIYGVATASQRFWNKTTDQLSIAEAATLAAVAKSARYYSPINAPANAQRRRNIILTSMIRLNLITQDEYNKAINTPLRINEFGQTNSIRLYINEYIRIWAEQKWGKEALYRHGLRIKITINRDIQEKAERAFFVTMQKLRAKFNKKLNGGMTAIDPKTGHIKALIGGLDFNESQYNRAIQAKRQIGSSFKPILYALALRAGIEMDSIFVDEPLEIHLPNGQSWKPANWNHTFEGPMTLARALTVSNNIIAIKLFLKIGAEYLIPWAKLFGLNLSPYPSAALGTTEANTVDNAAAFNVFTNDGVYVQPILIEWVKDRNGNTLWQAEQNSYRILDHRINSKMVNALQQRMILETKREPSLRLSADSIGKTGSTNEATSVWFVGATPTLSTAIYVGRDDGKPLGKHLFASQTTFPIWLAFYKQLEPFSEKHFLLDPTLKPKMINWVTGTETDDINALDTVTLLQ